MPCKLRRNGLAAALAAVLLIVAACGLSDDGAGSPFQHSPTEHHSSTSTPSPSASSRTPASTVAAPTHPATARPNPTAAVLAISIDGLNPRALTALGPSGAPQFWTLAHRGASTMNARTDFEQTVTLPNHASMFTGRRVDAAHGGHGWTSDKDTGGTIQGPDGTPVPSIFDVVHDAGGSTALFANKTKFDVFARTWPSIDRYVETTDADALVRALDADLTTRRRAFTFLHLGLPDHAGHTYGWLSPQYIDAVRQTDGLLKKIVDTIERTPRLDRRLTLIVTTDHGGVGPGHTDPADSADYTIPFFVEGPDVPADSDLYQLNPDRSDPGAGRPGYSGAQPIRNGDVANLVAHLLGLEAVPTSQIGVRDALAVTR